MIDERVLLNEMAAFLELETGRQVGVQDMPEDATVPYAIVYPVQTDMTGPPFWDPFADTEFQFQVTSVGERWDQARWMADKVRRVVLDRANGVYLENPAITGHNVVNRDFVDAGGIIEGDTVVSIPERFTVYLTPT